MSKPRRHFYSADGALCGRIILNRMTFTTDFSAVTCPQCRRAMAGTQPTPAYQFDEADHPNPEALSATG